MLAIFFLPVMALNAQFALVQSVWGNSLSMTYSFSYGLAMPLALVGSKRRSSAHLQLVSYNRWRPSERSRAQLTLVK
jgi:hypothetical protein